MAKKVDRLHWAIAVRPRLERLESRDLLTATYHNLLGGPLLQDWSKLGLITVDDNWSGVPSIVGYRGDNIVRRPGANPQNLTNFAGLSGAVVHVLANETSPDTLLTSGVAEFHLPDPVVALQGSSLADAPFLLFHVNTAGTSNVTVSYNLRDIDGSGDNSVQQVALQYRLGDTGPFINLPDGYVSDASSGPFQANLVTPVSVTLPAAAENQPKVQIRVITADALGNDEWIGVDDIVIAGTAIGPTSTLRIVSYNVTASSGTPQSGLDTVLKAIAEESLYGNPRPIDVLAVQEVQSQSTTTQAIVSALNSFYGAGTYARGSLNGQTTGSGTQGIVYNTTTVQLLGEKAVGTSSSTGQPRQALRYLLRPIAIGSAGDFYLYNSHYKADDDANSQLRRLFEAIAIRNDADLLGEGVNILYVGDFNMYTSDEDAYQELLAVGNGQAFDPINQPGAWTDNPAFLEIFTQAPAKNAPGGMAGGGIDDRFDFQLNTGELADGAGLEYVSGSYHPFGNNGSVPIDESINYITSTALPELANRLTVLGLLTMVADHLPVVAEYVFVPASTAPPAGGVLLLTGVFLDFTESAVVAEPGPALDVETRPPIPSTIEIGRGPERFLARAAIRLRRVDADIFAAYSHWDVSKLFA
jgi:exonuclease III